MEEIDQEEARPASPDIPKLPIKTYRWEDVRRSKQRGAYPWTHLTKPPYEDEVDPEEFTMDAFRRSRSTSTLGKSETHEIPDIEEEFEIDTKTNESSLQLPEYKEYNRTVNTQPGSQEKVFDTIPINAGNGSKDRAKSEEPTKKRRLSVDSSYSRISLPKLRLMEKLKSAKGGLKLPKLPKRSRSNVSETKAKKSKVVASAKKDNIQAPINHSPVYIHIPLKPPEGHTDEFSKYEFESPSHSPVQSLTNIHENSQKKRKTSLLDMLTQIKLVHDEHLARRLSQPTDEIKKTIKLKDDSDKEEDVNIEEIATEEKRSTKDEDQEPIIEIEESGSTSHTEVQLSLSDKLTIEEILDNSEKTKPDHITMDVENSSVDDISQCLDKENQYEVISEVIKPSTYQPVQVEFKPDPEKLRKLEGALLKWKKQVPKTANLELPPTETIPVRARSEEPKRKRRSSIDSSYSRKSLSKLAFLKKLKQAKVKIKIPKFPSFSKFDKKSSSKVKEKIAVAEKPTAVAKKTVHPEKPVYIHIPLKPPPGEMDEFSYLENAPVPENVPESKSDDESKEVDTPEPESENNVQLIILTPPSDDEILDSAGPETPAESDQKFFETLKIEDLKTLAKNAVNTVYPETKKLETVEEGEDSDTEASLDQEASSHAKHKILVDEEDGLKLSEAAIAMINEELEKEYKQQAMGLKSIIKAETSPVLKKKVSFKRKSRQKSSNGIYEDVQFNKSAKTPDTEVNVIAHSVVIPLESFQSMSVDEEKSYLDKQIIKTTSLEDDYNKWSKINDHEYEPIDPPPEVIIIKNPPIIHDNSLPPEQKAHSSFEQDRMNAEQEKSGDETTQKIKKDTSDHIFQPALKTPTSTDNSSSTLQKTSLKKESNKRKGKNRPGTNFNETLKTQASKIKSKIQSIKRPQINLPQRPKFLTTKLRKPNFKKPNIKMPKLPDRPTINLPSFNFTRKSSKDSWRERQFSTESNAGDSKKKIFDFRTYPRMFDRSKNKKQQEPSTLPPEFATMPRSNKIKTSQWSPKLEGDRKDKEDANIVRIPLHSPEEKFIEAPPDVDVEHESDSDFNNKHEENEDSLFSKDFLKRWEHGHFHNDANEHEQREEFNNNEYRNHHEPEGSHLEKEDSFDITPPKRHSSDSLSHHRRGVLEEIDSDEFFLREKGISQDDIEVGKYLSSEIREAFRNPMAQFRSEDREYDMELSDQSEPIQAPKRKPLRKPKRKKTPHVSREQISFDRESYNTEPEEYFKRSDEPMEILPPIRPNRRSSRKKKKLPVADVVPYQETISIDDQGDLFTHPDYTRDIEEVSEILPDNILSNDMQYRYETEFPQLYENEHMQGIEQPEITVSHTYYRFEPYSEDQPPIPPARRQRSLRSLSASDQGSILEEDKLSKETSDEHIPSYFAEHEYIIPTPEPPVRPRRTRSRTRSESVSKQQEDEKVSHEVPYGEEDTVAAVEEIPIEVIEAPCTKDIRDASGYAIIDKTKAKDPPLPPSRFDDSPKTPPRRRRSKKINTDDKFATVPRLLSDNEPPRRPLRNYSTLRGTTNLLTDEEKENLNLSAGHLQSGEVIQKMRDRPLPAPPRPPRRSRSALSDISHIQNIPTDDQKESADKVEDDVLLDIEDQIESYDHEETVTHGALVLKTIVDADIVPYAAVSKRTDNTSSKEHIIPVTKELDDIEPNQDEYVDDDDFSVIPDDFTKFKNPVLPSDNLEYNDTLSRHEKFVKPESKFTEDSEQINELNVSATVTDEEKINMAQNRNVFVENTNRLLLEGHEVDVLKAQKLQVCDLDVENLHVKELQASKIIVSELDGLTLQVSEINSKCGNLVVSGIDLPPNLIQEMIQKLQLAASAQIISSTSPVETSANLHDQMSSDANEMEKLEEKKTPIEEVDEEAPPVPPRYDSKTNLLDDDPLSTNIDGVQNLIEVLLQPPIRPPRRSSQAEKLNVDEIMEQNLNESNAKEPEIDSNDILKKTSDLLRSDDVLEYKNDENAEESLRDPPESNVDEEIISKTPKSDDEPPARPPEPDIDDDLSYVPSQAPRSFFTLQSPHVIEFFDEDIPSPSRRKRHHRPPPVSMSSSDEMAPSLRRRHRSPEQSIPQLTGQLVRLCTTQTERSIKRLISHFTNNVLKNADGKQDLHVIILLLIIFIAGLILLSDPKVTIHEHHWDYFNPPTDL